MSKARFAPIKQTSIPWLELLTAVVATELDQRVKLHLEITITKSLFWMNSAVLYFSSTTMMINGSRPFVRGSVEFAPFA